MSQESSLKNILKKSAKKYKEKHLENGEEAEKILGACKDDD